ncbi:metallophosphoesterase [Microbulbifer variabilis]|uniref:metallophosphoesterase n=1 Tax=Microbulbifer variabilis TaxID=266805 RepID=UPI001CFE2557|nr:metallophosphoesterase [Microbulbifer variabilis]
MEHSKYDIIGDIHGHGSALIELLDVLGYRETSSGYAHPERKVIFLGDFIDRGEHLVEHRKLLKIVMSMVNNGHAKAIMGNHEFNALAYHTEVNGKPLRPHTDKNTKQHQAFLNEYPDNDPEKSQVLNFFRSLPLWLDLGPLRAVHACWDMKSIDFLKSKTDGAKLTSELLVEASSQGCDAFNAVETLLKGYEIELPEGVSFLDKDGNHRSAVRVQWWKFSAEVLGEIALPPGINIGTAARLPVPRGIPYYSKADKPCFIGHYWLRGVPAPLTDNVACLDYSVAGGGKLVAYRFDGEQVLSKDKFVFAT